MKFVFTKSQSHQFRARLYSIKPVKVLLLFTLVLSLNNLNAQFLKQPINTSVCVGGTASFSVEATNPTATYQWQYSPNSFGPWNNIDLSTPDFTHFDESALNVTGLAAYNDYHFRCVISVGMFSSFSNMAKLNVGNTPSDITVAPQTVCEGANVTLTASQPPLLTRYRLVLTSGYYANWHGIQEIVGRDAVGVQQTLTCIGASSATFSDNPVTGNGSPGWSFGAMSAFDGNTSGTTDNGIQWLTPEHDNPSSPAFSTIPNTNWQNFGSSTSFYTPEWIEWSSPTQLTEIDIYNGRNDGTVISYFKDYYLLVSYDNGVTWSNIKQGLFSATNRLNTINLEPTYLWIRDGIALGTGKTLTIANITANQASVYGGYYLEMNYGCVTRRIGVTVNVKSVILGSSTVCLGSTLSLTVSNPSGFVPANPWSITTGTGTATITSLGVLSPGTEGTITVNYNGNGCSSTKQITVSSVSTAPTSTSGGGNYCHGNVINLASNGGTNGTGAVDVWYAATGQTAPIAADCNEGIIELFNQYKYKGSNCLYVNYIGMNESTNNGITKLKVTQSDPFIWMYPLDGGQTISAADYKYVNVRYKVNSYVANPTSTAPRMGVLFTKRTGVCGTTYAEYNGPLYPFSMASQSGHIIKPISTDGNWHIISFPVSTLTYWNGTITGLRIDFFDPSGHDANLGSEMDIDFITVSKHPMIAQGATLTLSPGDVNYPRVTTTFYTKKIDNCGVTSCQTATVVLPPIGTSLATNSQAATCNVKAGEKVHFYHSSGNFIATVNATAGNLGSTTATTYLETTSPSVPACNSALLSHETAVMRRHWVITPTTQNQATVFLPFLDTDLSNLKIAANSNTNNFDNVSSIANVKLSKYHGPLNVNNSFNDNCTANGGNEGTILVNPSSNGTVSTFSPHLFLAAVTDASYIKYNITSFSEFWLHGSVSSPLPVKLTNFSATCDNQVTLSWRTASEQNSDRFIVEKSRDGNTWNSVGEKAAAGNSNTTLNYTFKDANSWNATSYYRLRQIDFNGAEEVYGPISVSCENQESSMTVYPNPNNGSFTIEIESTEMYNNAHITMTDLTGKIVFAQEINVANGTTQILMDKTDINVGTYLVTLKDSNNSSIGLKPVKLMISK